MRRFLACLHKEWRDGRTVAAGVLAAMSVAGVLARLLLPDRIVRDELFGLVVMFSCVGVGIVAFASDLVPSETRRKTLGFLRRTPGGLHVVFLAKAVFLYALLAALAGFGWLLARALGATPFAFAWIGTCALLLAGWTLAVSCWLPRGSLAVPAAALLLALAGLPLYLLAEWTPGLRPSDDVLRAACLVAAVPPVFIAWWSFTGGFRFARGLWANTWRGLAATLLLFAPAWAYAGAEAYDWHHGFDIESDRLSFTGAYLGEGGRYVFANAYIASRFADPENAQAKGGPRHPVVIDLQTGEAREVGGAGDWFLPVGELNAPGWKMMRTRAISAVALRDYGSSEWDVKTATGPDGRSREWRTIKRAWMHYFDGATAARIKSGWSDMRFSEVERLNPRGPAYPEGTWARMGLGYQLIGQELYDPFRRKRYKRPHRGRLWIRPGRWLTKDGFYDPGTRETTPLEIGAVRWLLDDGRAATTENGRVVIVTPETGERLDLEVPAEYHGSFARTPSGHYLVQFQESPDCYHFARLDAATGELSWFAGLSGVGHLHFRLIAVLDDDTMLGIYKRRWIVKVRCGDTTREVLFPR